jgi:hypothetical protein
MAEIGATFPTEAEWLEDYESAVWCTAVAAGMNSCGDEASVPRTVSNGWKVRADVTDVTAAAVVLEVSDLGSAEAAEKFAQEVKASEARFDGDFDIPMNAEENKAGLRGTGTLVDFDRAGWSGYRMTQTSETTAWEGAVQDAATSTTAIVMTNGPLDFTLRVYAASVEPGVADAEVQGWLDRVFGPETSD